MLSKNGASGTFITAPRVNATTMWAPHAMQCAANLFNAKVFAGTSCETILNQVLRPEKARKFFGGRPCCKTTHDAMHPTILYLLNCNHV